MGRKKSVQTNVDNKIEMNIQVCLECEKEPETKPEPKTEPNEIIQLINKPKRGRKPKNASINNAVTNSSANVATDSNIISNENIVLIHSEEQNLNLETTHPTQLKDPNINELLHEFVNETNEPDVQVKSVGKKRGRKPKGGKIIQQVLPLSNIKESKPNIILHLKCSMSDLQNNLFVENSINGYDFTSYKKELLYEIISNNDNITSLKSTSKLQTEEAANNDFCDSTFCENDASSYNNKKNDMKDLWKKLKNLEYSLHLNNISDKKSACFWCTYEFDNPPIYIPKHYIKESYHVYGCFCSPECATAHLMEENIDSSTKFERYHLLNHIYSKIYDYTKNIKPAPKPHYMLEKFYGNLNIQEYRSLLKNERLFLVVDKPLTRILPELHEDNDDFIINNKIIPSNTYQIKRKMLSKQTKNNILSEKFGMH
jgi:hypothetical protein